MDLISVIVPVYNVEKYLHRCLDSIILQTYDNLEIILIDDGSLDNSGKICDEYAQRDKRIKVVHKKNGGLSSARNAGLDMARGDFISFVDSDDFIDKDMLGFLYSNLKKSNADISICGIRKINKKMKVIHYFNSDLDKECEYSGYEALKDLCYNSTISFSSCDKLYKSSLIRDLRFIEGVFYEDMYFNFSCLRKCNKVTYSGRPKYNYYMSETSISRGVFNLRRMEYINAYLDIISDCEKYYPELVDGFCFSMVRVCLSLLTELGFSREFEGQRDYMINLIRQHYEVALINARCDFTIRSKLKILKYSYVLFVLYSRLGSRIKNIFN